MNFFRENPFLGWLLTLTGVATVVAAVFLFVQKSGFNAELARFSEVAAEKNRLERLDPFPNGTNLRKLKTHVGNYAAALDKLKGELKARVLAAEPLAPNEFQSRLRTAVTATAERARTNKVKLPDNFNLGFEEYATTLPRTSEVAQALAQQLAQAERVITTIIDARVDSVTAFTRTPVPDERAAVATASPPPGARPPAAPPQNAAKLVSPNIVDVTFTAPPAAARKILNQLAASNQQFYIVRTLYVRNEKDKGPPREQAGAGDARTAAAAPTPPPQGAAGKPPAGGLNFIVGNEHVEVSARIEMVRFNL